MNRFNLASVAAVTLLASGIAQASTPCNGFELKIKNSLADDLLVTRVKLGGADIQPNGFEKLKAKTQQVFTVNNTSEDAVMNGEFVFRTISLPSKEVKIQYTLENSKLICEHSDISPASDYSVEKMRLPGKVKYTISNK